MRSILRASRLSGLGVFIRPQPIEVVNPDNAPLLYAQDTYNEGYAAGASSTSSPTVASVTPETAETAETAEEVLKGYRRLEFLAKLPGAYDYGARHNERRSFYKSEGLGENMGLGIFALNRPTMGFDIWSAVSSGVKKGIEEYKSDPNKTKFPLVNFGGPKISGPRIKLPSWLTQTAKAVAQPASKIGKNIISSVQAAKEKDRREAEARAAAVGASVPPEESAYAEQQGVSWGPILLAGAAVLGLGAVALRRRR